MVRQVLPVADQNTMKDCLICERIGLIKENKNPYFVAELETGYVVLGDFQFYRGYSLFLYRNHVTELSLLEKETKQKFLEEMSNVAEAVYQCWQPRKMNYELLGNGYPHLHWHLVPRHKSDSEPRRTIWTIDRSIREAEGTRPNRTKLLKMKEKLYQHLKSVTSITSSYDPRYNL